MVLYLKKSLLHIDILLYNYITTPSMLSEFFELKLTFLSTHLIENYSFVIYCYYRGPGSIIRDYCKIC